MIAISMHLASAWKLGAMVAKKTMHIAALQAGKMNPDNPMESAEVLQRMSALARIGYLEKHGTPNVLAALPEHTLISASAVSPTNEWKFGQGSGLSSVRVKPRLTVSNNDAAIEAALQGFGITRLLSYQVAAHLASGQLKIILSEFEPAPMPVHVLHREGRYASAKIRSFVDLIAARLQENSALN